MLARLPRLAKSASVEGPIAPPHPRRRLLPDAATVCLSGWIPHTLVQLDDIYRFLLEATANTRHPAEQITLHHRQLHIKSVAREASYLEYVHMVTEEGFDIRLFQDGLIVATLTSTNVDEAAARLQRYLTEGLEPSLRLVLSDSLAVTPTQSDPPSKNIARPVLVMVESGAPSRYIVPPEFGQVSYHVSAEGVSVYTTPDFVFVVSPQHQATFSRDLVDLHLFMAVCRQEIGMAIHRAQAAGHSLQQVTTERQAQPHLLPKWQAKLFYQSRTASQIQLQLAQLAATLENRITLAADLDAAEQLGTLFHDQPATLLQDLTTTRQRWELVGEWIDKLQRRLAEAERLVNRQANSLMRWLLIVGLLGGAYAWLQATAFSNWPVNLPAAIGIVAVSLLIHGAISFIYQHREYPLE